MDVHPTKNGINRYWSIPIWSTVCRPLPILELCQNWRMNQGPRASKGQGFSQQRDSLEDVCLRNVVPSIWHVFIIEKTWTYLYGIFSGICLFHIFRWNVCAAKVAIDRRWAPGSVGSPPAAVAAPRSSWHAERLGSWSFLCRILCWWGIDMSMKNEAFITRLV